MGNVTTTYTVTPDNVIEGCNAAPAGASVFYEGFIIDPINLGGGRFAYAFRADGDNERLGTANSRTKAVREIEELIGEMFAAGYASRDKIEVCW